MKLATNIWRLQSTKGAGAYLLHTPQGHVMIDTGLSFHGKALIRELDQRGVNTLAAVLLTHHDIDHMGNAARLEARFGCQVYIHSQDMAYAKKQIPRKHTKALADRLINTAIPANLQSLEAFHMPSIATIHAPGHTPGHSLFLFDQFLFCGDYFRDPKLRLKPYKKRTGWLTDPLVKEFQALVGQDFRWVCPGHFVPSLVSV